MTTLAYLQIQSFYALIFSFLFLSLLFRVMLYVFKALKRLMLFCLISFLAQLCIQLGTKQILTMTLFIFKTEIY